MILKKNLLHKLKYDQFFIITVNPHLVCITHKKRIS